MGRNHILKAAYFLGVSYRSKLAIEIHIIIGSLIQVQKKLKSVYVYYNL